VGVDANDTSPQMLLLGDHNLGDTPPANSSLTAAQIYGDGNTKNFVSGGTNAAWGVASIQWADNMHGKSGNVGLADGSVQGLTTTKFREALNNSGDTPKAAGLFAIAGGSAANSAGANRLQFP